tara:strand:+ start:261 stop:512 length:252 start_codon:yes stop_codon:yes gene_type:complete
MVAPVQLGFIGGGGIISAAFSARERGVTASGSRSSNSSRSSSSSSGHPVCCEVEAPLRGVVKLKVLLVVGLLLDLVRVSVVAI